MLTILATGSLFALLGYMCRTTLRQTLTRLQVIGFWLLAAVAELGFGLAWPSRPEIIGAVTDAGTATAAIVLTKWRIEGLPSQLRHLRMRRRRPTHRHVED